MEQDVEVSSQGRGPSPGVDVSWHELYETSPGLHRDPDLEATAIGSCKYTSVNLCNFIIFTRSRLWLYICSVSSMVTFNFAIFSLSISELILNALVAQGTLFKKEVLILDQLRLLM